MIQVFVVSLPGSPRREIISEHLNKLGIQFSFIDAVDGRKLDSNKVSSINGSDWVANRYGRQIALGEIGCTYSHLSIYKKMLNEGLEWAIILEDDVYLDFNIQTILNANTNQLSSENLYLLGSQEDTGCEDMIVFSMCNQVAISNHFIFRKTVCSARYIYRTASYLMHKDLAERILSYSINKFCLADDWISFQKDSLIRDIYLSNVVHHPRLSLEQSTIEKDRKTNTHLTFMDRLRRIGILLGLRTIKKYLRKILCVL